MPTTDVRGFRQVYDHAGAGAGGGAGGGGGSGAGAGSGAGSGAGPILLVHGWPETRRIWARNVDALAAIGFEVIAPDLRGFGDSEVGPDGFHDVPSHVRDLYALCHDELGHSSVVCVAGDLGGPIIQDLSLRFPGFVSRMVLFNSPLPYDRDAMAGMRTRPPVEAADYFIRQGTDADGLARDLATPEMRQRYIATFYTSRFWAHPGAFTAEEVAWHAEPFGDGTKLRASFGGYESAFAESARSEPSVMATPNPTETMILFGTSDHVLYPDFDRMAECVFPNRVGPFLLRDCGHFVQWEAAPVLNSAIRTFCRDLL